MSEPSAPRSIAVGDTAHVKYVYLDVVAFTKDRSVEAQSEIIGQLNRIASSAIETTGVRGDDLVVLPTGDGLCIGLLDVLRPFDIHLQLALAILAGVAAHNAQEPDEQRTFEVRLGVSENVDNVIVDFNGKRNLAGAGISLAQRVMDTADGGQILVSAAVFETLRHREAYRDAFRQFRATGKHGVSFPVFQYLATQEGLNTEIPHAFRTSPKEPAKLSKLQAYYLAFAARHREEVLSRAAEPLYDKAASIAFYFLAEHALENEETPRGEETTSLLWGDGKASFGELYEYYQGLDVGVVIRFRDLLVREHLAAISDCVEGDFLAKRYSRVSARGLNRLENERPEVWKTILGLALVAVVAADERQSEDP